MKPTLKAVAARHSLSAALCAAVALLAGCLDAPAPVTLSNPPADSVTVWPSTVQYARRGDTLTLIVHGLKRTYPCAIESKVGWTFRHDTTNAEYFRVNSEFTIPGDPSCDREPEGFDTLFRARIYTRPGNVFYLETPQGEITDSVFFVAEASQAALEILRLPPGADSVTSGRFTFRDSTAARPRRMVYARNLATCEFMQTAVYEPQDDSIVVTVRRIVAQPLPAAQLPACAGPRDDSIPVAYRAYRFP